jgi:hypothetical protein
MKMALRERERKESEKVATANFFLIVYTQQYTCMHADDWLMG